MSTLFRIVLVSVLIVSLGIPSGCAKKEEAKPKVTKKKSKKSKKVASEVTESATDETSAIRFPALDAKSDEEMKPEQPVVSQKTTESATRPVEATEVPLPKKSLESPDESESELPISQRSSKAQEKWVQEFETRARKSRPADDAKVNVLTREEYEAQFKAELNLHKKFAGQFIEVSGVVGRFGLNGLNERFMMLASEEMPLKFEILPYYTLDREPWAAVANGQKVKLRGWWMDHPGWIFEIVEKGPPTAFNVTPDEIVAEFKENESMAREKYRNKGILISGELLKKDVLNGQLRFVVLKTKDDIEFSVNAPDTPGYVAEKLEIGKPLKAYGELILYDDKQISFAPGFMISPDRRSESDVKSKP